jgi:hypothetical protein
MLFIFIYLFKFIFYILFTLGSNDIAPPGVLFHNLSNELKSKRLKIIYILEIFKFIDNYI